MWKLYTSSTCPNPCTRRYTVPRKHTINDGRKLSCTVNRKHTFNDSGKLRDTATTKHIPSITVGSWGVQSPGNTPSTTVKSWGVQSPGNIPSMTAESCDCSSWTLLSAVTRMKNDSSPSFDSHTISAIRDPFQIVNKNNNNKTPKNEVNNSTSTHKRFERVPFF